MKAEIIAHAGAVRPWRINPWIFGHFVEDIRDHMDAMLAYPLTCMDFENHGVHGVSEGWFPVGDGRSTQYALEPAAMHHSGHSQMIRLMSDDCAEAGIGQKLWVEADTQYQLRVCARASNDIRFLDVRLTGPGGEPVLSSVRISLDTHRWKNYEARLVTTTVCRHMELHLVTNSRENPWRDNVSTGMLWIDHVSLLPVDACVNVRRDVTEIARSLNAGMLRLAGNYISAYHWDYAVGDVLRRPCMVNEAWGGWTSKYFGTDEFLAYCEELQVEPLICVNAGSATPEEAADWVRYCNDSPETPMGKLRAANGREAPYKVRYWEIGNEIYGPWQVGHCDAETFAYRALAFCRAMKEADPDIRLIACGDIHPEWNRKLLEVAAEYLDAVTLHIYHGFGVHKPESEEERMTYAVSMAEFSRNILNGTRAVIRSRPDFSHIRIAVTEYNTMYYQNTIRKGVPDEITMEAAVANAGNMNEFLRQSDLVEIGSFSDLVNGWLGGCIRVGDFYADQFRGRKSTRHQEHQKAYLSPTGLMMQLYAGLAPQQVAEVSVVCPDYHSIRPVRGCEPGPLPVLDTLACLGKDGEELQVYVVNRAGAAVELSLVPEGIKAGTARCHEIAAETPQTYNSAGAPETVTTRTFLKGCEEGRLQVTLKPCSVNVFCFTK